HVDPSRDRYLEDLGKDFEAGAAGVKLLPLFHGYLADHPGFIKVYELCEKHKKPVILDLSWYFDQSPLSRETPARQKLVKSFADYARVLSPVFRQFAALPISLAHGATDRALPANRRSTSSVFPASPHSSRCLPSTYRSPGCVMAASGGAGTASGS